MKKLLCFLCMSLSAGFSNAVLAEWVPLGETSDAQYFYDPATLKREGEFTFYMRLVNFTQALDFNGTPYQSGIARRVANCNNGILKSFSVVDYSGKNATGGEVVALDLSQSKWRNIEGDAVAQAEYKTVCSALK
jgi:hypothetical protein